MYRNMDQWIDIRRRVLVEKVSKRQILRETRMHWRTLEKILEHSEPPGYRRTKPPAKPKIGPFVPKIIEILESDKQLHRKQRHTAKRIWQRLVDEDQFDGGYTTVKDAVRELRSRRQEAARAQANHGVQVDAERSRATVLRVVNLPGRARQSGSPKSHKFIRVSVIPDSRVELLIGGEGAFAHVGPNQNIPPIDLLAR